MWQDPAIATVVLLFTLSVVPMVLRRVPVPLLTGLIMTGGSLVLCVTYVTLGLWFSFGVEVASTLLWGVLFIRAIGDMM